MLVGFHQWLQKRPIHSPRSFNPSQVLGVLANRIIRIREVSSRKRNNRDERKRRRNLRRISEAVLARETGYFDSFHARKDGTERRGYSLSGFKDSARNIRVNEVHAYRIFKNS